MRVTLHIFPRLRKLEGTIEGFKLRVNRCDNKGIIKTVIAINEELSRLRPERKIMSEKDLQTFINIEKRYGASVQKFENECKCTN